MTTAKENWQDCCQLFAESFELSSLPAMRDAERRILGCDYGGTSWTTRDQARRMAATLGLGPGANLLEIGAGSGWPGLFAAKTSGCDVILLDLPCNALAMARARARHDGIDGRVGVVCASGTALPFGDRRFDVISHSDVLCCLPDKRALLEESRRVAGSGARMYFSVIATVPGLSKSERDRAAEAGPPFVEAPRDYGELLRASGWRLIEREDVTGEYELALQRLLNVFEEDVGLTAALGGDALREARVRREEQIAAVGAGLLCRETFLVTAA